MTGIEGDTVAGSYTQSVIANAATTAWIIPGASRWTAAAMSMLPTATTTVSWRRQRRRELRDSERGEHKPDFHLHDLHFRHSGTLGSTAVVTQGATGLDFAKAGTLGCTAGTRIPS